MHEKTNILISGLLWSGSSAVLDMMKEYSCIGVVPGELDDFRRPGMIADHLEGRISEIYPSKISMGLMRFLRPRTLVKSFLKNDFSHFKRLKAIKEFDAEYHGADTQQEKMMVGKNWLRRVQNIYANDKPMVVFDQPILPGQHFLMSGRRFLTLLK
jgi:hypothetical protein